jgi:hypothetical protein
MRGSPASDTLDRWEQRGRELLPERAIWRYADVIEDLSTSAQCVEGAVVDLDIWINDEVKRMREEDRRGRSD